MWPQLMYGQSAKKGGHCRDVAVSGSSTVCMSLWTKVWKASIKTVQSFVTIINNFHNNLLTIILLLNLIPCKQWKKQFEAEAKIITHFLKKWWKFKLYIGKI